MTSIMTLAKELKLVTMNGGEILFSQGDIGNTFYVVLTGQVHGLVQSEELD